MCVYCHVSPVGCYIIIPIWSCAERPLRDTEHVLALQDGLSQLELRKLKSSVAHSQSEKPKMTSKRVLFPSDHTDSPARGVDLQVSKLRLHTDLIKSLREFASTSNVKKGDPRSSKSRESILEQALVEQNEILNVMEGVIVSLERENEFSRQKVEEQRKIVEDSVGWKSRARDAERQLQSLKDTSRSSLSLGDSASTSGHFVSFENALAQKDQLIALLQDRLKSVHSEMSRKSNSEQPSSPTSTSAMRVHLTAERVRVIELEQELSAKTAELAKIMNEVSEYRSTMLAKESEIQHLRNQLEVQKRSNGQQKELVTKQRQAMADKDVQLSSLVRALEREKKVAEQFRKRQHQSGYSTPLGMSKVADVSTSILEDANLFDLVCGRDIHTVQIARSPGERAELGFSYAATDLPISCKLTCIIVKTVERGGPAFGKVYPGDEILEVNGHGCRCADQKAAIECLESDVGVIKLVLARDRDFSLQVKAHSTPFKPEHTTLWATAVSSPTDTVFMSFTDNSSTHHETHYVSCPESSQMALEDSVGKKASLRPKLSGSPPSSLVSSEGSVKNQDRSELWQKDGSGMIQELQAEVSGLHEQLEESERTRLDLEIEVDELRSEFSDLQAKLDSNKSENSRLQEKAASHDEELAHTQQYVLELKAMLVKLENQVTSDVAAISSLENQNKGLSNELIEAKSVREAATKEKVNLEKQLNRLREERVEAADTNRRREEELQLLVSERDRLSADIDMRNARIKELSTQLEKKATEYHELQMAAELQSKQLHSEITSLKESSVKISSSTDHEFELLQSQYASAKSSLLEAQAKEEERKAQMNYLKQAADAANDQLKVCQEKLKKTEEDLSTFKQLVENKTLEMESLTLGLTATQHKLEGKQESLSRLQHEVDSLRRSSAKLQNERTQHTEALHDMKSTLKAAESEVERLKKKLELSVDEKDTLFQELEKSIAESTQLQLELDKLQRSLKEAEAAKERENEFSVKVDELTREKRALQDELDRQIDSYNAEKKVLENELSRCRSESLSESTTVQEQLLRQEEEIRRQRDELVASEGEKAKLSHNCDTYKKREGELLEQIQCVKSAHESISSELNTANAQKEDIIRELEASQRKVETLDQQCVRIKEKNQMLDIASESLRNEVRESKREIETLTANKEDLMQQLKALQEQFDQVRGDLDKKNQDFLEVNASHSELQEKAKIEQGHFEELRGSVSSLKERNAKLQAEKKRSDDMIASLEFIHQQNQKILEQATNTVKLKETELTSLRSEIDETTASLKKERREVASLKQSLSDVRQQLDQLEAKRNKEVTELKEQLSVHAKDVNELRDQLQAERSDNAGHLSLIAQLKSSAENTSREKHSLQSELDSALKEKAKLESTKEQLEGQLARSRSEISQLEDSSNLLSSESASLKIQLKHSSHETDELSAQLQAMEMNLEVANRTLDESESERLEWTSQRENMEVQVEELKSTLKQTQSSLEEVSLQLHARDEEISRSKASLEMRQKECTQLQESLLAAKSSLQTYEKNTATLETEKLDLHGALEQSQEEEQRLRGSLASLERQAQDEASRLQDENKALQNQCNELSAKVDSYVDRVETLERRKRELEETVNQVQAGQEALKRSLNSQGDEKDREIVKLRDELNETRQKLDNSRLKETDALQNLEQLQKDSKTSLERCSSLEKENETLKERVEDHKKTSDQLSELESKLTALQEALRTKTGQLGEAEQSLRETRMELKRSKAENEGLSSEIAELANVKFSLVEKSAEVEKLRGDIATASKQYREIAAERDHMVATLRKMEVEKHSAAVKVTPQLPRSSSPVDKEQLTSLLREKEEDAKKLKDYVNKLLLAVVEKAPFVLEHVRDT